MGHTYAVRVTNLPNRHESTSLSDVERNSSSNSCPHDVQTYSYIGMPRPLPASMLPDTSGQSIGWLSDIRNGHGPFDIGLPDAILSCHGRVARSSVAWP